MVDVSLLAITPIPLLKIIFIITCDLCWCIKCLVLWRFVGCAPQKENAEDSLNSKNDGQNPTQAKSLGSIAIQELQFAAIETLIVWPQQGFATEVQISNKKPA
jgi:hypothetical protein